MAHTALDDLLDLEHRGWDALCAHRGGTFYGEIMTDDAVMILVNGMLLDRDTIAASLDDSPPWDTYSITEPRLVPLGPGADALVYRATAARGDADFTATMSSTYRTVDGRLRLALYQQTTVTH